MAHAHKGFLISYGVMISQCATGTKTHGYPSALDVSFSPGSKGKSSNVMTTTLMSPASQEKCFGFSFFSPEEANCSPFYQPESWTWTSTFTVSFPSDYLMVLQDYCPLCPCPPRMTGLPPCGRSTETVCLLHLLNYT